MNKKLPLIVVSAGSHKSKWMFLLSLLAGCALTALPGFAQTTTTDLPKPVVVTNTPSTPVPTKAQGTTTVAGTVNIGNAPNVNVANTPNVNVTNTPNVNIANTPSVSLVGSPTVTLAPGASTGVSNPTDSQNNAIPLATTEGAQFFDDACTATVAFGAAGAQCTFHALPLGKRLVIQEFDINQSVPIIRGIVGQITHAAKPIFVRLQGLTVDHSFAVTLMGDNGNDNFFATHQPTHTYANQAPICSVTFSDLAADGSTGDQSVSVCAISGYLLDTN